MRAPLSLRLRLVLLVCGLELLLVAAFAASIYWHTRHLLMASFDGSLSANAEALATLVADEGPGDGLELEFSDEVMTRFSRGDAPDLFVVLGPDRRVVERSRALSAVPDLVAAADRATPTFRDFVHAGAPYRGIVLPSHAQPEEDRDGASTTPITVFFAASRADLDADLSALVWFLVLAAAATLGLTVAASLWATRRGLAPLSALANDAARIDARCLDRRFVLDQLPSDLRPLGLSFNQLLGRLEQAFDRERRFSADAAHELRTPLAALKSGVQATLLTSPDTIADRQALGEMLDEIQRLEDLCESLLSLTAATEQPGADRSLPPTDLVAAIQQVAESLRPLAATTRSAIAVRVDPLPAAALAIDATATRRIVANLVRNALVHGGAGVAVEVLVSAAVGPGVVVMVTDNGAGISAELAPRLFQRFARGDASRTRATGGAGLGLAISRALAQQWGGTLTHRAGTPGGCCFVWTIAALSQEAARTTLP